MTAPPPRRPWHRRKRTWAAAAAFLLAMYPASLAPASYLVGRGWLPSDCLYTVYRPLFMLAWESPAVESVAVYLLRGRDWGEYLRETEAYRRSTNPDDAPAWVPPLPPPPGMNRPVPPDEQRRIDEARRREALAKDRENQAYRRLDESLRTP